MSNDSRYLIGFDESADDDFLTFQLDHTPEHLVRNGYIVQTALGPKTLKKAKRLSDIETAVAQGIERWYLRLYDRRRESVDYDYWLTYMGSAWTSLARSRPGPESPVWIGFRRALWAAMQADHWLKFYDCEEPEDFLWCIATIRAHAYIFPGGES